MKTQKNTDEFILKSLIVKFLYGVSVLWMIAMLQLIILAVFAFDLPFIPFTITFIILLIPAFIFILWRNFIYLKKRSLAIKIFSIALILGVIIISLINFTPIAKEGAVIVSQKNQPIEVTKASQSVLSNAFNKYFYNNKKFEFSPVISLSKETKQWSITKSIIGWAELPLLPNDLCFKSVGFEGNKAFEVSPYYIFYRGNIPEKIQFAALCVKGKHKLTEYLSSNEYIKGKIDISNCDFSENENSHVCLLVLLKPDNKQ